MTAVNVEWARGRYLHLGGAEEGHQRKPGKGTFRCGQDRHHVLILLEASELASSPQEPEDLREQR